MKKTLLGLIAFGAVSFGGGHGTVEWGYEGEIGPSHWGDLSPAFIMCKIGKNQSPIDISKEGLTKACLHPLEFHYTADTKKVLNNGHTVKFVTEGEGYIILDGRRFYLRQFHFHTPSEHTVNGKYYPMEVHLVHTDREGNIAVLGVLFEVGKRNPHLDRLIPYLPAEVGKENILPLKFNPYFLLPKDKDYYRYSGSLTTPPCSEGVRWVVFKQAVEISPEQLEAFERAIGMENNRPVQPLNARRILY